MNYTITRGLSDAICARAIKYSPTDGLVGLTVDEYEDLVVQRVREAELRQLREESNRIHPRLLVFTLELVLFIAALPLLALIAIAALIGYAIERCSK